MDLHLYSEAFVNDYGAFAHRCYFSEQSEFTRVAVIGEDAYATCSFEQRTFKE